MKKTTFITLSILLLLLLAFFLGPRYHDPLTDPKIDLLALDINDLDQLIQVRESGAKLLKKDNEARIVWSNDSLKRRTPWSVVYLHGFSASQGEGDPVHYDFAKYFGCNMYLARIKDHGVAGENIMEDLTAVDMVEDAKHAIQMGKLLGKKVLIMSTSTGGTLALYLAAHNPEMIDGLILYSPNIDLASRQSAILNLPWGLQIARMINGDKSVQFPAISSWDSLYWTKRYRLEGVSALRDLMKQTMTSKVFELVKEPLFLGYYYKDEVNQDRVVSVPAMLQMYDQIGTSSEKKRKVAFPNVGRHVIASKYKSEDWETVLQETIDFAEEVLEMQANDPLIDSLRTQTQ